VATSKKLSRSYSGALHLDALKHARSTYVRADGRRDGRRRGCAGAREVACALCKMLPSLLG
jgi:hypothetical protein